MKYIKLFEEYKNNIDLTNLIITVRSEFLEKGICNSYSEINSGFCVDFVDEIEDRFSGKFETLTTNIFNPSDERIKEYLKQTYNDTIITKDSVCWSKNMLDEYGYPDTDLLDEEPPAHIWIYYNGKHYDAEAPNGVDNPWDLPIFDEYNW